MPLGEGLVQVTRSTTFTLLTILAAGAWISTPDRTTPALSARSPQKANDSVLSSDGVIKFTEIAEMAGVTAPNVWGGVHQKRTILETKGNGVAFIDFDHDGWLDVYLSNGTRLEPFPPGQEPTNHLYHNNGNGTFVDVTKQSGLAGTGWQTGVCAGDYDNDGWDDLLLTYWGQNKLFHNNHDGTFADATERAGLRQPRARWNTSCNFLDYDRDGFLDIFVANYLVFDLRVVLNPGDAKYCQWRAMPVLCGPRGLPSSRDMLLHNNGNGTFDDVSEKSGIAAVEGKGLGSVSYDFSNDGWPDIYVANDSTPSFLFLNNRDGTFAEVAQKVGVAFSEDGFEQGGMGVAVADYDKDGLFDIFKTNFMDDTPNLYRNNGDGTFRDLVFRAGLGKRTDLVSWGVGFIDVDNDGWKDLLYVNGHVYPEVDQFRMDSPFRQPRLLYRNLGTGQFEDISSRAGPAFNERYSSRGCAFGDFNNDGKVDVLITNMNDQPSLWINESQNSNVAILVKLLGTRSNRSGIGARVRVVTGKHVQMDEVHSGDSVMSMGDLRMHFGLGKVERIDLLEVRWPSAGKVEQFRDLAVNQIIEIREGAGIVRTQRFRQPTK